MRLRLLFAGLASLSFLLCAAAAGAEEPLPPPDAPGRRPPIEAVWEFDAYYSNFGVFIPLTDQPIPDIGEQSEFRIYSYLLRTSWPPRFVLVEASIDPMPILGVYLKKNHRSFYDDSDLMGVNLIESVTAGFQEPYALTLFFGNVATFVSGTGERISTNKGYLGYMFSVGDQHIKGNVLIHDRWLEAEWKLKGDRVYQNIKHHWSFRLGAVFHSHRHIADAYYLGLHRSLLDFSGPFLSWLNNTKLNLRSDFFLKNGQPMRQEVTIGKKYPLKKAKVALTFDVGFIWEDPDRYGKPLRDSDDSEFTLILRPNLEF